MDIVISRILKYLNGCLDNGHKYKIGSYIVKNYPKICKYDLAELMQKGKFSKDEIIDFCRHLGYQDYESFRRRMISDDQLRLDQINARMLNMDVEPFLDAIDTSYSKEEFRQLIDTIVDLMFTKKRIVIIGSHYPCSVAVEFQTDMIVFGKEVVEYHSFDEDFMFDEDDMVVFLTATGRTMEEYVKETKDQNICVTDFVLVTQNIRYREFEKICADYVLHVLGKFDGIQFNYQVMLILDLFRIRYYQKYYAA